MAVFPDLPSVQSAEAMEKRIPWHLKGSVLEGINEHTRLRFSARMRLVAEIVAVLGKSKVTYVGMVGSENAGKSTFVKVRVATLAGSSSKFVIRFSAAHSTGRLRTVHVSPRP